MQPMRQIAKPAVGDSQHRVGVDLLHLLTAGFGTNRLQPPPQP
jgi:hypothetical protein